MTVEKDPNSDVYVVAKDFSRTYVRTHEREPGPYLCIKNDGLEYLKFKYERK